MPKGSILVGIDELASGLNYLQSQIDAQQRQLNAGQANLITIPEPAVPYAIAYSKHKNRIRVQGSVNFPSGRSSATLRTVIVPRSARVDQATFKDAWLTDDVDIDENSDAAGHIEYEFGVSLDYATDYDLVRLILFGSNGEVLKNPQGGTPQFGDTALAQFTTPPQLGAPSGPSLSLIVFNERDFLTADQHDAHVGLKVYAPLTDAGGAQTYSAAGVDWVRTHLTRDYPAPTGTVQEDDGPHLLNDVELTQVDATSTPANRGFVVIEQKGLAAGATYNWTANTVHTVSGKTTATGSVSFNAANEQGDLSTLTNVAISVKSTVPFDGKHIQPFLEFTQPAIPVALRNYTLKYKFSTDVDWNVVVRRDNSVQADAYALTLNTGTISGNTGTKVVTGAGTNFTRLEAGWKIKTGAQTFVISDTPTSDTSLTLTALPGSNFSAAAYTIVCVVPLVSELKAKPSTTHNIQVLLRARSSSNTPLVINANVTTDADGNVIKDTTAPIDLAVPVIDWTAAGRLRIRGMNFGADLTSVSQTASLKKKYLVIYDGSTTYLDIVNRTTAANEAAARFEFGLKSHLVLGDIKKKIYKTVFGSSGSFKVYWYAENDINTSLASGVSNTLNVTDLGEVLSDNRDAVNVIDVGTTLLSPQQIVINGDFFYNDGGANVNGWRKIAATSVDLNTDQTVITTTTSDHIFWDDANHQLKWINKDQILTQNMRKRVPKGDYFAIVVAIKTDGTFGSGTLAIEFANNDNTTSTVAAPTINLVDLTTSYQLFGFAFQADTTSTYPAQKWFKFSTATTLSATNNIIVDKVMLVRGKQPTSFASRGPAYEGNGTAPGTAEDITLGSMSTAVVVDTASPSGGSKGGYVDPGSGGRITPDTL